MGARRRSFYSRLGPHLVPPARAVSPPPFPFSFPSPGKFSAISGRASSDGNPPPRYRPAPLFFDFLTRRPLFFTLDVPEKLPKDVDYCVPPNSTQRFSPPHQLCDRPISACEYCVQVKFLKSLPEETDVRKGCAPSSRKPSGFPIIPSSPFNPQPN